MQYIYLVFFSFLSVSIAQTNQINCTNINIVQNDTTICKGDSIQLSVPDGYNYLWSTGDTTSSILLYPSETTSFSVQISSMGLIDTIDTNVICDTYEFSLGDVNYDQVINVQDIVLIVDLILADEYNPCGDVNCDQILDESDIFIIENFILGFDDIPGCVNCVDDITITVETCGCIDPFACNYCSICTMDDGSCWYLDDCDETIIDEEEISKVVFKEFDFLGKNSNNQTLNIKIYTDGTNQKNYLIK